MSANRNRPNLASHEKETSNRQPKTLGLIILAAGGFSTWYWYKPLPPEATRAAYADWEHHSSNDGWASFDTIGPPLETMSPNMSESAGSNPSNNDGLASDSNPLLPVPAYRKNLRELVAGEPLPSLPNIGSISSEVTDPPKAWTNPVGNENAQLNPTALAGTRSDGQNSSASAKWPDLDFKAQIERDLHSSAKTPPPLLTTLSSSQQRIISTQDSEDRKSTPSIVQPYPASDGIQSHTELPRTPHFIRQPKRN